MNMERRDLREARLTSDLDNSSSELSDMEDDTFSDCYFLDDLAEEVICAERLSQMTKTYNDIDAVTHLLEEKERDLELAARIGQSLLQKNNELMRKNSDQEEQLVEYNDKLRQLRHDIAQKDTLLQMYLHEEESSPETPEEERLQSSVGVANISGLQKKVQELENENLTLRSQSASLRTETVLQEEREDDLFRSCLDQLEENKVQVQELQDEVLSKGQQLLRLQDELDALTGRLSARDDQLQKTQLENAESGRKLQVAYDIQNELSQEVSDLKAKIAELEELIQELQDELRSVKRQQKPAVIHHHANLNSPFLPQGSLALELENSIRKDVPCPPGYTPRERRRHNDRVMETARVVKKSRQSSDQSSSAVASSNDSCESIAGSSFRGSLYLSEGELSEAGYGADVDSIYGSLTNLGRPGLPGSNDLETALRRLSRHDGGDERDRSHTYRSDLTAPDFSPSCQTPDSLASRGSCSNLSEFSRNSGLSSHNGFRIPEKLQIVKPLEGSYTLHQWKRLATPNLLGALEPRPGIQTKGECPAELLEEEVYSLSDYEEDDDISLHLGKCMEQTSGIYTFTTAKILHPSDEYGAEDKTRKRRDVSPVMSEVSLTYSSTPLKSSGVSQSKMSDFGTSTFSMSASLARGLQERGTQESPRSQPPCPTPVTTTTSRYSDIVTETVSSSTQSHTQVLYTTANARSSATYSKGDGRRSGVTVLEDADEAYLHLADKVKDIGLNSILSIAKNSGIAPVRKEPADAGLNVIMSLRRRTEAAVINRNMAEKASQTIRYSRYTRPKRATKHLAGLTTQTSPSSATTTRGIMAAPLPTWLEETLSSPSGDETPESEDFKTLPPSCFLKRPNTLNLAGGVTLSGDDGRHSSLGLNGLGKTTSLSSDSSSFSGVMPDSAVRTSVDSLGSNGSGKVSVADLCAGVTVSGNTLSSGLLSHLTSFYSRTREMIGASVGSGENAAPSNTP